MSGLDASHEDFRLPPAVLVVVGNNHRAAVLKSPDDFIGRGSNQRGSQKPKGCQPLRRAFRFHPDYRPNFRCCQDFWEFIEMVDTESVENGWVDHPSSVAQ